ncbi:MAG: hypothetical protein V4628_05875 [Pseudomonadota bacterium]
MNFMLMVFLFVFALSAMGMFFDYRKQQLKMMEKMNQMEEGTVQRELTAVKQRLAVLEKIITDKRYDLNEEINSLRNRTDH